MEHTFERVEKRIITLVARTLNIDPDTLTPDVNLIDDLGADSLDALTIALDVDREFGIKVDDSELGSFGTCRDIAAAVIRHLDQQGVLDTRVAV